MQEFKTFIIAATKSKTDSVINFVFKHTGAEDMVKLYIINSPEIAETFRHDEEYKMKLMVDNEIYFDPIGITINFNTPITQERMDKLAVMISAKPPSEKESVYVYIDIPEIPVIDTLKVLIKHCVVRGIFIGEDTTASIKEKEVK